MTKDSLGDRMKADYEDRTRYELPRRTYTMIRVDGKAFHTLTKEYERPFSRHFMQAMDQTAQAMCAEIVGARLAFVQSDEISILLTDFDTPQTQAWFGGNLQKIVSVSAALATAHFNANIVESSAPMTSLFDSRVWTIPMPIEVENYLIWRQQDATRNSINMVAQSLYSHKELHGVKLEQTQELIFQKGINWNNYPVGCKRGRLIVRESYLTPRTGPDESVEPAVRSRWSVTEKTPIFTQDRSVLRSLIPIFPEIGE